MELIQPDIKSTYDKCKYVVKLWEHTFKKKHGRLPSKLDIREADRNVRNAYKTYFKLKSAAIEGSFLGVDGFNSDEDSDSIQNNDSLCATQIEKNIKEDDLKSVEVVVGSSKENPIVTNIDKTCTRFSFQNNDNLTASQTENSNKKDALEYIDINNRNATERLVNTNTDKTWGEHLSYSYNEKKKTDEGKQEISVNLKISQKLFNRTKLFKRNSKKSLSFHHRKSESNLDKPQFFSQPSTSSLLENSSQSNSVLEDTSQPNLILEDTQASFNEALQTVFNDTEIKIATLDEQISSQPLNVFQSVSNKKYTPLKPLDMGWLERVSQETGTELISDVNENANSFSQTLLNSQQSVTKLDYDSDIIETSDNENTSQAILHVAKKLKSAQELTKRNDFSNIFTNKTNSVDNVVSEECKTDFNDKDTRKFVDVDENVPKKSNKKTLHTRKSCRVRKERINLKSFSESDESDKDPFHTDNESDDPEYSLHKENKGVIISPKQIIETKKELSQKNTKKRTSLNVQNAKKNHKNENDSTSYYELEYSVKPRIKSVPRIKDIKTVLTKLKDDIIEDSSSCVFKNKSQLQKEKLEKKIQSGTLNENFVRINLKKKVFVKGKKTMTFSKYKKQMWKNKKKALSGPDMDMGGCDGGTLVCFNCNKPGHFARQCKETKGDSLLPLEAESEICPYPTLEEASQMASKSVLAVRKPNYHKPTEEETCDKNEETYGTNNKICSDENIKTCVSSNQHDLDKNEEILFDNNEDDNELVAETAKLEECIAKLNMQQYLDSATIIEPIFSKTEDGNIVDTPKEVFAVLNMFGYNSFRPGQERAIMRILSGLSTLVTLSTGSGKSLCYQIPAYLYSQKQSCISLVISPLVSLMEDQVTGIPSFLKAACLHTNQTKVQREKVMGAIRSGDVNILLVSPEAVVAGEKSTGFGSLLRQLPPIAFACIDEVHCLSQWSHNFRPSYLMLCRVLRDRLGVNTVLGLTATATNATKSSIIEHLQIPDGFDGIISDVPLPDNLTLNISRDLQKDLALLKLISSERFVNCKSIIVYCTRRDECERIATYLRTCLKTEGSGPVENNKKRKRVSVQAEPYHAGLSASRRKSIQKSFMSGELKIVVATVAFGMGINKSDIRSVIHYNMPKNFESYVQEVGRAGRDGLPAYCHLFLDSQGRDENELRRHIYANSMDRHVIRKLLQKTFIPCSCKTKCPKHEVAFSILETVQALDVSEEIISTLLCYLELHDNRYIEVLSPAYTHCKVISYGGPMQIRKAAKDCPPLAMALALHKKKDEKNDNVLEFPVIDVAAAIGWDSGICKHKLKNLEWTSENNQVKRSVLSVQFTDLGFRILAPGNLTDSQLDDALDSLYSRVVEQECIALQQLHAIYSSLTSLAFPTFKNCLTEEAHVQSENLKSKIRHYFNAPNPLETLPEVEMKNINEDQVVNDTRALICMYRDNSFTGRAVARIFHGISSPNYPAVMWGRCKYWRAHIHSDFNTLCKIATREILQMK